MIKPTEYPNGPESFKAASEVLHELIPYYYGAEISSKEMYYATMEFERLMSFNYRPAIKPHCEVWEQRIVSFAEDTAKQLRYEAQHGIKKIVRYTDTANA